MLAIDETLAFLSQTKPIFHSEADFQHALAWCWRERSPDAQIRLEYRLPIANERSYADLWIWDTNGITHIELKYWTRVFTTRLAGETFVLADQSAQDLGRYDFIKDVERVERTVQLGLADRGYVVTLTTIRGTGTPRDQERSTLHSGCTKAECCLAISRGPIAPGPGRPRLVVAYLASPGNISVRGRPTPHSKGGAASFAI